MEIRELKNLLVSHSSRNTQVENYTEVLEEKYKQEMTKKSIEKQETIYRKKIFGTK